MEELGIPRELVYGMHFENGLPNGSSIYRKPIANLDGPLGHSAVDWFLSDLKRCEASSADQIADEVVRRASEDLLFAHLLEFRQNLANPISQVVTQRAAGEKLH
jgi:hypothetical protein